MPSLASALRRIFDRPVAPAPPVEPETAVPPEEPPEPVVQLRQPGELPPLPPPELRRLVCHDESGLFEITPGALVYPEVAPDLYESVFDFGCGCGRVARRLMCQDPMPRRYLGIDIHRGMIEWCQKNLTPFDPAFTFALHDVWNLGLAPESTRQSTAPFPAEDGSFTFVNAHSIFTHLYKEQTEHYLAEIARILTDRGVARTTWFLFDKQTFPMMWDFQVTLFINEVDPTNAVIYDWRWLLETLHRVGLRVSLTRLPDVRGHQWDLFFEKRREGDTDNFPAGAEAFRYMCGTSAGESFTPQGTL